jgi:prepilin-type N-terminal cleavage/methylation domain-containing protein
MSQYELDRARATRQAGFTLVELVVAIVITAILITVAMRAGAVISRTGKVEETKQKMEALAYAIAGNPSLTTEGVRSDYGYVGDIGALPPNLTALYSRPSGYATWRGPYVRSRFAQIATDYGKDAWGADFVYSAGTSITSNGSGSNIVRTLASSTSDLLLNRITGTVLDLTGAPPSASYKDSVLLILSVPNGSGGISSKQKNPDAGGFFSFDSIPIGNHDLQVIYRPSHDTLRRFMSVAPGSSIYSEYRFSASLWGPNSGVTMVPGSDSVSGSPSCSDISFWITNNTGASRSFTSIKVSWPSPTAYYGQIYWGSTLVFNKNGSPRGISGQAYTLSSAQTLANGQKVRIRVLDFRQNNSNGGGSAVSMSNRTLTILLSDGSSFTEVLPTCP